jgi:foldase protein PrsA
MIADDKEVEEIGIVMSSKRVSLCVSLAMGLILILGIAGCGGSDATATPDEPAPTPGEAATMAPPPVGTDSTSTPTIVTGSTPAAQLSPVEVALEYVQVVTDTPLATVNGEVITWEDYEPSLHQALRTVSRQGNVNWSDPAMQQRLGDLQNDVLEQTAERWVLRRLAEEMGIVVTQDQVESEFERQKSQIVEGDVYDDWAAYLSLNGFTDASLKQVIYDTILLVELVDMQEVDTTSEQVHIAHIAVGDTETADEVVARLDAGEDFADLAAAYSLDTQTRDDGGDLGWFSYELMTPELAKPASTLAPGEHSGVIATQQGFTVIKVLERGVREADPRIVRQRKQQAMMAWFESSRGDFEIEYLYDFTQPPGD